MSRGPLLEQIDGCDPTFRVVADRKDGKTVVVDELLLHHEARPVYLQYWDAHKDELDAVRIVNERSGFTVDELRRG